MSFSLDLITNTNDVNDVAVVGVHISEITSAEVDNINQR